MSLKIEITACSVDDMIRQIRAMAKQFDDAPQATLFPRPSLADFQMTEIIDFLKDQGFTLAPADAVVADEVVEQKSKKQRKSPVKEEIAAPVSLVASTEEKEEDSFGVTHRDFTAEELETMKEQTIDRLQELYFEKEFVQMVDGLRKKYAGKKKFSDLPAEMFIEISAELLAALGAVGNA